MINNLENMTTLISPIYILQNYGTPFTQYIDTLTITIDFAFVFRIYHSQPKRFIGITIYKVKSLLSIVSQSKKITSSDQSNI